MAWTGCIITGLVGELLIYSGAGVVRARYRLPVLIQERGGRAEPGGNCGSTFIPVYLRASGCGRGGDRLQAPRACLVVAPGDMQWLAPRAAAVPASIGGPADQPPASAMIAWLIEAGEQFLIDTEVCAPPGQVGGWTTPSADSIPSGPGRPMTTVLPPACNWPRLA